MGKINAVRFININYNKNAIRITDETMHFNGRSTLIELRNGGGKSVMVQLLTAPFVHKRYRGTKNRKFSGFFTTARPSFILVEWALDYGAGYVMTGMMARHSQNEDDGDDDLEIINFISEYNAPCLQDINHLPVAEKTNKGIILKSFAACRQLFETYKKEKGVHFFYYDMNNSSQARQYFDKLMEYGINYREWESVIKKLNDEESGLSKLFADCKDERGLIEKWFLESVESKMNRDKNRMQGFREILEKYISLYHDNQTKIRRKEAIRRFDEEAVQILEQGKLYAKASDNTTAAVKKIAAYIKELERILSTLEADLAVEQDILNHISKKLYLNAHQRHSAEYYYEKDYMAALKGSIAELERIIAGFESEKEACIRRLNLMRCSRQQEIVNEERAALVRAEEDLEMCRQKNKDLAPERDYLGYRIRLYLTEVACGLKEKAAQVEGKIKACESGRQDIDRQLSDVEAAISSISVEKGRLKAEVEGYDQSESRFNTAWHMDLARNIMGEYEAAVLIDLEKQLGEKKEISLRDRTQKKKELENLNIRIRRQERDITDLSEKRWGLKRDIAETQLIRKHYEEEIEERKKILQYLDLKEDLIFDLDRILKAADGKIMELDLVVKKLTADSKEVSEKIRRISEGRPVEISEDLAHMFESLGIHFVYGMEWLKKNDKSEEENLVLLQRHPFLPYAIIMSNGDLRRLEECENTVHTSFPVAIVTRESLANDLEIQEMGMPAAGSTHFFIFFNNDLLNEEKLGLLLKRLEREKEAIQRELSIRNREYGEYLVRKNTLLRQKVTLSVYREINEKIESLENNLTTASEEEKTAREDLVSLTGRKDELTAELSELETQITENEREMADLQNLQNLYEVYLERKKQLWQCREQLKQAKENQKQLKERRLELEKDIRTCNAALTEFQVLINDNDKELAAFDHFKEVTKPADVKGEITLNYERMMARFSAITDHVSREIRDLEKDRESAVGKVRKAMGELERLACKYGFSNNEWVDVNYNVYEEEQVETEIKRLDNQIRDNAKKKEEASKHYALSEQRQSQCVLKMKDECGTEEPLLRQDVPRIDFEKEKILLLNEKSVHERKLEALDGSTQLLNSNIDALAEFSDVQADPDTEWEEDFGHFTTEQLRTFTGDLKRNYKRCERSADEAKDDLLRLLNRIIRMPEFQEDYYKKPLEQMIAASGDAYQVLEQLDIVQQAYHNLMEKLMADISIVEEEKLQIAAQLQLYVKQIHEQLGKIDRNSTIPIQGKSVKMLKIDLPVWEESERQYHTRVIDLIDDITEKGLAVINNHGSLYEFIGIRMTTRELYDAVIGIGNIHLHLYKVETQRVLPVTWKEVAANSGGEGFLSAFVILSSLLYYMRRDDTDIFADRNEGKVLLMDNPFAQTNAEHLLKPLMEVAKKNNSQMLCLTGLGGDSIYGRFDNVYVLYVASSVTGNMQYLKAEHARGMDPEIVSFSRIEVGDDEGMLQTIF